MKRVSLLWFELFSPLVLDGPAEGVDHHQTLPIETAQPSVVLPFKATPSHQRPHAGPDKATARQFLFRHLAHVAEEM